MAVILDSTDPGALIAHAFLSLFYSFGIFFYKLGRLWGKVPKVQALATSSHPLPLPHP